MELRQETEFPRQKLAFFKLLRYISILTATMPATNNIGKNT